MGKGALKARCGIYSCTFFCVPLCLYKVLPGHSSLLDVACGRSLDPFAEREGFGLQC